MALVEVATVKLAASISGGSCHSVIHAYTFTSLCTHNTLKSTLAQVFPRRKEHGTVSKLIY